MSEVRKNCVLHDVHYNKSAQKFIEGIFDSLIKTKHIFRPHSRTSHFLSP